MNKTECLEHEWEFEPGDWCPVCQGISIEKERRNAFLNRVQTMYEEKQGIWLEGYEMATNDIIKLLESELGQGNPDFITERDTTIERLIALIKVENK